jgi:ubiquinone/menaquinone biosynthesis C-methylase UbiE
MAKDNFSTQAQAYARYRPDYPEALYQHILAKVGRRERALDLATGNGQAAAVLARHFGQVEATDISAAQLAQAPALPNVRYQVASAEQCPFPDQSFDLVTVAQAFHWFWFEIFFEEMRRILRPGGVLAVWGYGLNHIEPAIDAEVWRFYEETVGPYWDPERRHIEQQYQNIHFPFESLASPMFAQTKHWQLSDLAGYLNSWSAVQHFAKARGYNPVEDFVASLETRWPAQETKAVTFPIFLKMGIF